jgi:hypothetical protein
LAIANNSLETRKLLLAMKPGWPIEGAQRVPWWDVAVKRLYGT